MIPTAPDAIVVTDRAGFIRSMNATAEALLAIPAKKKARTRELAGFFVKGRIALLKARRDVYPGGEPIERDAWILATGRGMMAVTVSLTGLDDGFRWVVRPLMPHRSPAQLRNALTGSIAIARRAGR